jgi:hypothetical protein
MTNPSEHVQDVLSFLSTGFNLELRPLTGW